MRVGMGGALEPADLESSRRALSALAGDRYEIVRPIARGGMSIVLLGWDRAEGRLVALKLLDPGRTFSIEDRERFRREAEISARLIHPHIVPCYEFRAQGSFALAVMRYVPGPTLADRLAEGRALPVDQVLALLLPLTDALDLVHGNGVIHRDVKPANILLDAETDVPFLTDFGIATLRTSEHSRSEVAKGFGTPAFMSPEQALGRWDADGRTDVYSLGLVAYRALAGVLPFSGDTDVALAAQRTIREARPLRDFAPHVPKRLARVIHRCLARDPARRWRNCRALYQALATCREAERPWLSRLPSSLAFLLRPFAQPRWPATAEGTPAPLPR